MLVLKPAATAPEPANPHNEAMSKLLTQHYTLEKQLTRRRELLLVNSTAMYNSTSLDISQRTTTIHSQAQLAQEYNLQQLRAQIVVYAGGNGAVLTRNNCLFQQLYSIGRSKENK